jgi:3-hydroxyacyl-CoA dehydrogenase
MSIEKVAVIGSGVMGSGIAAQIANAGISVVLLDIKTDDGTDLAANAVQRLLKTDPAPFMHKSNAKLIQTGNMDDHLDLISDCDWIIEVVLEDLKIKHATYEKILKHKKKGAVLSSNTSTIPLAKLIEPFEKELESDFMITHFFNPPRYMRLLELVTSDKTSKDAVLTIQDFCDVKLGKGVVHCHDTPGFIANRLGVFWLTAGINDAIAQGLSIEKADAVMSRPVGIPKTGIFALVDLVGIDLMPKLADSLLSTLPDDDWYRDIYKDYGFVHQMIESGYTGRKGKGGFYRLNPDAPKGVREKQALALDENTFSDDQYNKADRPKLKSIDAGRKGLRAVVETDDEGGRYAWSVLSKTLAYAASLLGTIADTVVDIDDAMKLGYNWKKGPFEMMDDLGPAWFKEKLIAENIDVPEILNVIGDQSFYKIEDGQIHYFGSDDAYHKLQRPDGVLLLRDIKLSSTPVLKNSSAKVWDIGDGILCFEKTSKMNTFDDDIFALLQQTIGTIGDGKGDYKGLVVYNEASNFSAGANLGLALFGINIAMFAKIESFIEAGQMIFKALKFAPFPVVAAPSGMALGGGCEILLHADHVQAHAETYCGLVEVGVGLIPGWGGCKEMILRFREQEQQQFAAAKKNADSLWFSPPNSPMGAMRKAFEVIGTAQVAKSAAEAKSIGYFRESDGVTMNRDRLLHDAKQSVLNLAKDYTPPEAVEDMRLPGPTGKMALDLAVSDFHKSGRATDYDVVVSDHLASVLSGGDTDITEIKSEDDLLALERGEFQKLLRKDGTMDRIEHMLSTGKPLRN